jgi:ATP-dependent DNA helicase RecG
MFQESQIQEFKLIWKDEYLKHICAFANTDGGYLFLGIDDNANVIGISDAKRLMEIIPNKTIQQLGVVVDLELKTENSKEYIIIKVRQSPMPLSYNGKYYRRSGSTIQELQNTELQFFILKKLGKSWDELPKDQASLEDIDEKTVQLFIKKAIKSNRLPIEAEWDSKHAVLTNLNLIDENGRLKNAALLLFGKNPNKYFSSVSFRIGKFGNSHHDLLFHDVIEGNLFEMPDKVLAILKSKYLVMNIRYEGLQRIEELEYPEDALREAILNAIIHKDYTGVHIQMSIYSNKIILWNPGKLPLDLNINQLKDKHPSIPRNKYIANIFFKSGNIEAWGRGINKIVNGFASANLPEPIFEELGNGLQVTMFSRYVENVPENVPENRAVKILNMISSNKDITMQEISTQLDVTIKTIKRDIAKLKEMGKLKRIGPDKGGYWVVL